MIMVPVMILQIFLFPYVATVITDNWTNEYRTLELQDVAGHLGSSIQQLYLSINRIDTSCMMKLALDLPQSIDGYAYTVTLGHAAQIDSSYKVMNVTLQYISVKGSVSTLVTLGDDIDWNTNSFNSTQTNLCLTATATGGNIQLTVGGA
jgi:hypothetical protein